MSNNADDNEKRPVTDDLVDRLRNGGARCSLGTDFAYPCKPGDCCDECDCARDAADEIERLRAVVDAMLDRPFRGDRHQRRDRMYGSDWEAVHDALDAWEADRG